MSSLYKIMYFCILVLNLAYTYDLGHPLLLIALLKPQVLFKVFGDIRSVCVVVKVMTLVETRAPTERFIPHRSATEHYSGREDNSSTTKSYD